MKRPICSRNSRAWDHAYSLILKAIPVIIETSYIRGNTDKDAINRLGKQYKRIGDDVRTAISGELEKI